MTDGFGAPLNLLKKRSKFVPSRRVRFLDQRLKQRFFPLTRLSFRARRNRRATIRTPVVVGCERFATVPTRFSNAIGGVVPLNDTRFSKDVLGVLGRRDVLVGSPHVRVERPMHPMLDLGPAVALTDHARDGGVPESVGRDARFNVGAVGHTNELLANGIRPNAAVVTPPAVAVSRRGLDFVEQRHIGVVGPRMGLAKIRSNRSRGIDQRVRRDRRALQPRRVPVRRVRRRVRQVNVAHSQRQREREARASVSQKFDEGNVALVARCGRERLDVGRFEHVVGLDVVTARARAVHVFRPLRANDVLNQEQDRVFVGFDRAVGQIVLVTERENEVVKVRFVHFGYRRRRALTGEANAAQVDLQRASLDRAVLLPDPSFDWVPVDLVDGRAVSEASSLGAQPFGKLLRVVGRHRTSLSARYYKLTAREPTFSIASERAKASPASSGSGGVAA